jgi:N12 class adenine-specific DNA methylase
MLEVEEESVSFKRFQDKALAAITVMCISLVIWTYQGDHARLQKHLDESQQNEVNRSITYTELKGRADYIDKQQALLDRRLERIESKLDAVLEQQQQHQGGLTK